MQQQNQQPRRLIRKVEVMRRVGLGRSAIDDLERAGRFPRRTKISDAAVAWDADEIDAWISERLAAREQRVISRGVRSAPSRSAPRSARSTSRLATHNAKR
jgi:prophage regulatory protein